MKAKPYPKGGPKLRKHPFIHDPALEQAMRLTYQLLKKYRPEKYQKPLQNKTTEDINCPPLSPWSS